MMVTAGTWARLQKSILKNTMSCTSVTVLDEFLPKHSKTTLTMQGSQIMHSTSK